MPDSPDEIRVLTTVEDQYLDAGERTWQRIDPDTLRKNLDKLVASLAYAITPTTTDQSPFEVAEISVGVTIGAGGQVGIFGTGVDVSAEASLNLTLKPRGQ
jgi:hypothetical protein